LACKYKKKGTDTWYKSKEALATAMNVTDTLKQEVSAYMQEVGKTDIDSVKEWLSKKTAPSNKITLKSGKDVVPTTINGNTKFYHASGKKRVGRLNPGFAEGLGEGVYFGSSKEGVEYEFGPENTTEVQLALEKPLHTSKDDWRSVMDLAEEMYNKDYFDKNKGEYIDPKTGEFYDYWDADEIAEFKKRGYVEEKADHNNDDFAREYYNKAARKLGFDAIIQDGSQTYGDEILVLDESKIIYPEDISSTTRKEQRVTADEAVQEGNIVPDGEVQPVVAEGEQQGVQAAADVQAGQGKAEAVEKKLKSSQSVESITKTLENSGYKIQYQRPDYVELSKETGDDENVGEYETRKIGEKITISKNEDGSVSVDKTDYQVNGGGLSGQAGKSKFYDMGKTEILESVESLLTEKQINETKTTEPAPAGRQDSGKTVSKESAEVIAEVDAAIQKTGVEATQARREIKEKYGAEKYQKAVKITREFEKIITRLENEGKISKKCP